MKAITTLLLIQVSNAIPEVSKEWHCPESSVQEIQCPPNFSLDTICEQAAFQTYQTKLLTSCNTYQFNYRVFYDNYGFCRDEAMRQYGVCIRQGGNPAQCQAQLDKDLKACYSEFRDFVRRFVEIPHLTAIADAEEEYFLEASNCCVANPFPVSFP